MGTALESAFACAIEAAREFAPKVAIRFFGTLSVDIGGVRVTYDPNKNLFMVSDSESIDEDAFDELEVAISAATGLAIAKAIQGRLAERSDVQPPRQDSHKPRLSDAAQEKRDPRHDNREHYWDWLAMTAFEKDRENG